MVVTYLQWEKCCDDPNAFIFDRIFFKLGGNEDRHKISFGVRRVWNSIVSFLIIAFLSVLHKPIGDGHLRECFCSFSCASFFSVHIKLPFFNVKSFGLYFIVQ